MKGITVLIASGGTGGHVIPALNLGKFLKEKGINVIFMARKNSFEENLYKKSFFKIEYIEVAGFKGKNLINKFKAIIKLLVAFIDTFKILSKYKPDAVIGFGGYLSFPVVILSKVLGFKTAICEQNAVMGLSNRMSSIFVDKVFLNFKNTLKVPFWVKKEVVGNFVKKEIMNMKSENINKNSILIFGGSQGAEAINKLIGEIIDELKKFNFKIIHITGVKNYEKMKKIYGEKNINFVEVIPFTDRMEEYYKRAKIVISRAGATSISEFITLKLNAILIPYPYSADNHQWYNACEFLKSGKGAVLLQKYLNKEKLLRWVTFFAKRNKRFDSNEEIIGKPELAYKKLYRWITEDV